MFVAGGLCATVLGLAACQKPAESASDPYAGLSEAILVWHGDIEKTQACAGKPTEGGKGCNSFEVGCKVMQPADKGATAKVIAAMSWSAWNPKRGDFDPASGAASFSKVDGKWVRHDLSGPVNLTTCATG